ncbi:MAG: hypothetical protein ACYDCL_01430 [Myxococcales bacterium]
MRIVPSPLSKILLVAALLATAGVGRALELPTSPPHFVLVVAAGWSELLGRPGGWAGDCGSPLKSGCPGQIRALEGFSDVPSDLGTSTLGAGEIGMGFGLGLLPFLSLQILGDVRYAAGGIEAGQPVSQGGNTFQLGPGFAGELLVDLPVDLRLRLGSFWALYGGVAPGLVPGLHVSASAITPGGSQSGSMNTSGLVLLWRAGLDRFFDYRATAIGVLVEGAVGGGLGALLTFTFHGGDNFETIR